MTADPKVLAATQAFLQFYVTGKGAPLGLPDVQGLRRRRPALQGPPLEFVALDRDPGSASDLPAALIDMCGVEDFVLIDGQDHLTLVLLWCTDYPASALSDELPGLSGGQSVEVSTTSEAQAVALECVEKLESFLGEDFAPLELECQVEFLSFQNLSAVKASLAVTAPGP
jgi:hypothetical protein